MTSDDKRNKELEDILNDNELEEVGHSDDD